MSSRPRILAPLRWAGLCLMLVASVAASDLPSSVVEPGGAAAELVFFNRPVATLRASIGGFGPAERVTAITGRLRACVRGNGELQVSVEDDGLGRVLRVDGQRIMRLTTLDLDPEATAELGAEAQAISTRLSEALHASRGATRPQALLHGALIAIAATIGLLLVCLLGARMFRWSSTHILGALERRVVRLSIGGIRPKQAGHIAALFTGILRLLWWAAAAILVLVWLETVLAAFPFTQPWADHILGVVVGALASVGGGLLASLPNLATLVVIAGLTLLLARMSRAFFGAIERGLIEVPWLHADTAQPTRRIAGALIWLLGLIVAYPYLPGSGTEAFKAVGVFTGLMLTIGSSGLVGQAMSGLILMYSRALKPGEFVRIDRTEGQVLQLGVLATKIRTPRGEEVTIPNGALIGHEVVNFSRAGQSGACVVAVISIGYDTPWRQVHALLKQAGEALPQRSPDAECLIWQSLLLDHAVEYQLAVPITDQATRPQALSALHALIQDGFNTVGVAIMSPRYIADPETAKTVPVERWWQPPAQSPAGR